MTSISFGSRTAVVIIAFAAGAVSTACGSNSAVPPPTTVTVTGGSAALAGGTVGDGLSLQRAFVRVVKNVSSSVVQIETSAGLGSGVVFDAKGDIVTNAHVVGSSKTFTVTLANGDKHPATLVGTFVPNDIAVVHVEGVTPPAAHLAHSSGLAVGDVVLAIGNPLGLRSSVTQGIVSSLGRTVSEGNGVALASVIQTSAAINPGNSGGALVNLMSEVVGIPTLAALDPEFGQTPAGGIGFAIPSDTVKLIADQLIRSGKVSVSGRAFLGVSVTTPLNGGVLVASVQPGGPAAAAGMEAGDRIVSFNKTPVASTDDLAAALASVKPGATIPVTVERNGKKSTLNVTVGQLKSG